MPNLEQEAAWIAQAKKGDDRAFGNLVEAYQIPVYNLCYRMLGTAGDAEDASQEAFLRAYRNMKRYDSNRNFTTWILSIASHYCIDLLRKRRINWLSIDNDEAGPLAEVGPSPEATAVISEKQAAVQIVLKELAPVDRSVVVLKYWYDMSYEEIAGTLNLTESAVKSRLHRARRDLAKNWMTAEKTTSVRGLRDEASAI